MRTLAIPLFLLFSIALGFSEGCSTRAETPIVAADSTVVYPGKTSGDVMASITFASKDKVSKRTGNRLGVQDAFDIEDGGKVHAFVDLRNRFARGTRPLSFHLVWIKPNDVTLFKKRVEYEPSDVDTTLSGSLSVRPGSRAPGVYTLRVYLFRELIAERSFTLRGTGVDEEEEADEGGVTM